ncbi:unnamed protein product [Boreogadus saida]
MKTFSTLCVALMLHFTAVDLQASDCAHLDGIKKQSNKTYSKNLMETLVHWKSTGNYYGAEFFCLAEKSLKAHDMSKYDPSWRLTDSLTDYIKLSHQNKTCTLKDNESIRVKDLLTIIKNCTYLIMIHECPSKPKCHRKKEFNRRFVYLPN